MALRVDGVKCLECDSTTQTDDPEDSCDSCGSLNTIPIQINPCESVNVPCESDEHDFSTGDHVTEHPL